MVVSFDQKASCRFSSRNDCQLTGCADVSVWDLLSYLEPNEDGPSGE